MRRRRKNVPTAIWYVVGTVAAVAAVGGATWWVIRKIRAPKAKIDVKTAGGCPPDGNYVGGALETWPHKDVFLDESGFGEGLESFGYDVGEWSAPGWSVCNRKVQDAVLQFARDYNAVLTITEDPPVGRLPIDGMIRAPKVIAMAYVDALQRQAGYNWPILVDEVRKSREEEQS